MTKRKKSQVNSQVFIYIIGLIIISLLILFGYNAVKNFREKDVQSQLLLLKQNIRNDVIVVGSSFGNAKIAKYELPEGFDEICIINPGEINIEILTDRPLIKDSVESEAEENVFLLGRNFEAFYIDELTVSSEPYISCGKEKNGFVELNFGI